MNILNIEQIHKIYGDKTIFDHVSCGIDYGEKIGIVGLNGSGKTTLLKIIAGEETPDEGQLVKQNNLKIAFLSQHVDYKPNDTVISFASSDVDPEDWTAMAGLKRALNELGMLDEEAMMAHLSGGQKKRVALAKVLSSDFDVLLLDEPTNHLDESMLNWLEETLNKFKGTVIMVTHDRYFLDKVCNKILEIDHGDIYTYQSNYSGFLELKAQRQEMEEATERKRKSVLRMELEWAKRGCRARTTKQKARLQRLDTLKNSKGPEEDSKVLLESVAGRMGKKTIELDHVTKGFEGRTLINDWTYIVLRFERLGIVGPNGCGKSTILKLIAGLCKPDQGSIEIGETIKIGYFSQEVPDMDTNMRVIDYIKDVAEYIETKEGKISASQMLERFLFSPDMQYSPVSKLSGGEKKRLYLMKILISGPNVLLLDEVNNDLDIPTMTILEDYLSTFPGIIITVSHDRYFLDNVVDRIFEMDGKGGLIQYEGGYTDYIEAKKTREVVIEPETKKTSGGESKATWKQERAPKLKFSYKEEREYETIDDDIAALEDKIQDLDKAIIENATSAGKLIELTKDREEVQKSLDEKTERWVYLTELAEKIEEAKK